MTASIPVPTTPRRSVRLELAAWALVATQVVHAFIPAETESEGYVGLVVGLLLLVASLAAVYGIRTGASWAASLAGGAGLVVAVGFVAYHGLPFRGPFTNPYPGEPVGAAAWIGVALAVAAGAWAAYEGLVRSEARTSRTA